MSSICSKINLKDCSEKYTDESNPKKQILIDPSALPTELFEKILSFLKFPEISNYMQCSQNSRVNGWEYCKISISNNQNLSYLLPSFAFCTPLQNLPSPRTLLLIQSTPNSTERVEAAQRIVIDSINRGLPKKALLFLEELPKESQKTYHSKLMKPYHIQLMTDFLKNNTPDQAAVLCKKMCKNYQTFYAPLVIQLFLDNQKPAEAFSFLQEIDLDLRNLGQQFKIVSLFNILKKTKDKDIFNKIFTSINQETVEDIIHHLLHNNMIDETVQIIESMPSETIPQRKKQVESVKYAINYLLYQNRVNEAEKFLSPVKALTSIHASLKEKIDQCRERLGK